MSPPDQDLDTLIKSWPRWQPPLTAHIYSEVAYAFRSGAPLETGSVVPGCLCEACTGVPDSADSQRPRAANDFDSRARWLHQVETARHVTIRRILERLGVEILKSGSKLLARSPFRDDRNPSLHVDLKKNLWYDFGAAVGGDGIKLWMMTRQVDFATAIREITQR